jgi:hypothetical protein
VAPRPPAVPRPARPRPDRIDHQWLNQLDGWLLDELDWFHRRFHDQFDRRLHDHRRVDDQHVLDRRIDRWVDHQWLNQLDGWLLDELDWFHRRFHDQLDRRLHDHRRVDDQHVLDWWLDDQYLLQWWTNQLSRCTGDSVNDGDRAADWQQPTHDGGPSFHPSSTVNGL